MPRQKWFTTLLSIFTSAMHNDIKEHFFSKYAFFIKKTPIFLYRKIFYTVGIGTINLLENSRKKNLDVPSNYIYLHVITTSKRFILIIK